jgi:hypothetical protein
VPYFDSREAGVEGSTGAKERPGIRSIGFDEFQTLLPRHILQERAPTSAEIVYDEDAFVAFKKTPGQSAADKAGAAYDDNGQGKLLFFRGPTFSLSIRYYVPLFRLQRHSATAYAHICNASVRKHDQKT